MLGDVDVNFATALPKVELHAHLTGSISPQSLHDLWKEKRLRDPSLELEDPLLTIRPNGVHHDIISFFPVFDKYIYELCNDARAVEFCTNQVLEAFEADGVCYLELRTTPRESLGTGMTKDIYVSTVLDVIEQRGAGAMSTFLILSIDRRNTHEQAMQVVELAIKYQSRGVVGVDLCGNPMKGSVNQFKSAFLMAKSHGLKVTIHFAEVPESSTEAELRTLLSYEPDRIGHVINVSPDIGAEIERRKLGLELCLSCNVHANMTTGGFGNHHLGKWLKTCCPIALSTDDVGIFGSPLSNEYLLAAQFFNLDRKALIRLSRSAVTTIFGGMDEKHRVVCILDNFEKNLSENIDT